MRTQRTLVLTAVMLMISIGNYFRIQGNENIKAIQFLSIFVIGMLSGLLIRDLFIKFRKP